MRDQIVVSRRAIASALPLLALATPAALAAFPPDPIFAQIELHKALRIVASNAPGNAGDPTYDATQEDEEAAIQALGDMLPSSIAAAAAQLTYMAEVEGDFANKSSPLLRTVQTAAKALTAMSGGMSS